MTGSLRRTAAALRAGERSASDLVEESIAAHQASAVSPGAYRRFHADAARAMALRADELLASGAAGPLVGIPVSVKDLYGVEGWSTFAGTSRELPARWSREGWLVRSLREQGAVFTGKTHTVEFAYGGVGVNPHWGTPRNPWDRDAHRIPGGSSSGAGVSLMEGSALVALGSDTGGSIRIPASMTGTVGPRFTHGRWPTDGVVPLSPTMDTVGGLTRSVEDAVWFFGALDPDRGDPLALLERLGEGPSSFTIAIPSGEIWSGVQGDVDAVLQFSLEELFAAGWSGRSVEGGLLEEAQSLYMGGCIVSAEFRTFLENELPGWMDALDPTVASRIQGSPRTESDGYRQSMERRSRLIERAGRLFEGVDVLVLPGALLTPPPLRALDDISDYLRVNALSLQPTCPVSMLGLCAITIPVGLDESGMPVGLQFVAPGGRDERLLGVALAAERVLGRAEERLGTPPITEGMHGNDRRA